MKKLQISLQFLLFIAFLISGTVLLAQDPPEVVYFKGKVGTKGYPADAGKYTINKNVLDGRGCACYDHESGNYSLRRVEALGIKWYVFAGTCENPTEAIRFQDGSLLSGVVAYNGEGCNPVIGAPDYFSLTPYSAATLFPQPNFGGTPIQLSEGEYDLSSGRYFAFNDKTQSIQVSPGYTVEVFTDWRYTGKSKGFDSDVAALDAEFNEKISSVKIARATNGKSYITFGDQPAQQFIEVSGTSLAQKNEARTVYALVKTSQTNIGNIVSWGTRARSQRNGFAVRDGKAAFIGEYADYTGTIQINDGQWHHIVMTYDGATMEIYVDGKSAGSAKLALNTQGQNLRLGNISAPNNAEFFIGDLKDVKIWNEKLEAAEITSQGVSTTKKAVFSYEASQFIPARFSLKNMSFDSNWK